MCMEVEAMNGFTFSPALGWVAGGLLAAGLLSGCASNVNAPATLPAVDPQPVAETSAPTSVTVLPVTRPRGLAYDVR